MCDQTEIRGYKATFDLKKISIYNNQKEEINPINTQGICYYRDKIYYFDNTKNSALIMMDIDG